MPAIEPTFMRRNRLPCYICKSKYYWYKKPFVMASSMLAFNPKLDIYFADTTNGPISE